MAEFIPFKGIRYNPRVIGDIAAVMAPPYDVISPLEQKGYYAQHPHNVVRLILGQSEAGDDEKSNAHTRAAVYLDKWLKEGILLQESQDAFYLTAITFPHQDRPITRFGIIGRLRLRSFEDGVVLPHERTFSKIKTEQLRLMQACQANLSPIFGLYADREGLFAELARTARTQDPLVDFADDHQLRHSVWVLTDARQTALLSHAMRGHRVYIADGHHRYETALNYRDWLAGRSGGLPATHPANFVLISLSGIEDPGMIILPAHRLLKQVPKERLQAFISTSRAFFDVTAFPTREGAEKALAQAQKMQKEYAAANAILAILQAHEEVFVLRLKPGIMQEHYRDEPESLRNLDVTVLTRLVMMELLGYDQARLDDETSIAYQTDALKSLQAVRDGEADMAFVLNPTRIEQVKKVSEEGLIMPRKSTYFYPKVISGLVINPLW